MYNDNCSSRITKLINYYQNILKLFMLYLDLDYYYITNRYLDLFHNSRLLGW